MGSVIYEQQSYVHMAQLMAAYSICLAWWVFFLGHQAGAGGVGGGGTDC